MEANERESVKRLLIEAIGENKVLHSKAELEVYRRDAFTQLMNENERDRFSSDFAVLPETTADSAKGLDNRCGA